jgi:serine/threonine protein phosphatase PrpC
MPKQIFSTQIVGSSHEQEDRISQGNIEGWVNLTDEQKTKVLNQTVKILQTEQGQIEGQGSTLLAAIIDNKKIHVAYVGDSRACLVNINKGQVTITWLNPELHNPKSAEAERIKNFLEKWPQESAEYKLGRQGLTGKVPRVGGKQGIAVSRAIGDRDYEPFGLTHQPDITSHAIPTDGVSFIITGSDGFFDELGEAEIIACIPPNLPKTEKIFFESLSKIANKRAKYSTDDISFLLTEVSSHPVEKAIFLAVFDGHGGSIVSENLSVNFANVLAMVTKHEALEVTHLGEEVDEKSLSAIPAGPAVLSSPPYIQD